MRNLEELKKINNDIKILINDYDLTYLHDIYDEIMEKIINEEKKEYEKKMELEKSQIKQMQEKKEYAKLELDKLKFCCSRCNNNLENDNIIKYNEEITKKGVLFACKTCSLLINTWLDRGCKEKSFIY